MTRAARSKLRRERTPFEIAVLVVALTATAAIVAGLVVAGLSGGKGGPNLVVSVGPAAEHRSGGIVFEIVVRNEGGATADNVTLEATLGEETREITIVSVAKGDEERAGVVFPPDATGTPTVRVLSYNSSTRG